MNSEARTTDSPIFERPAWSQRRFAFGQPEWMLADFIERLRGLVPRLGPLLEDVSDEAARVTAQGRWSIAQNVGHLSDTEELWQIRLGDLREGRTVYTPADPARFQAAALRHHERPLTATVAELDERRSRLALALAEAPQAMQAAAAYHERLRTPMRLVDCAQFYAEHDDHHLLRIRELRAQLGIPAR